MNPLLVEVSGKFPITFTEHKLILITMVRKEKYMDYMVGLHNTTSQEAKPE